jgi:hypothetical protein
MHRYILRRTRDRFAEARGVTGEQAAAAMTEGKKQLQLVKRQVTIYHMFQGVPSIMSKQ